MRRNRKEKKGRKQRQQSEGAVRCSHRPRTEVETYRELRLDAIVGEAQGVEAEIARGNLLRHLEGLELGLGVRGQGVLRAAGEELEGTAVDVRALDGGQAIVESEGALVVALDAEDLHKAGDENNLSEAKAGDGAERLEGVHLLEDRVKLEALVSHRVLHELRSDEAHGGEHAHTSVLNLSSAKPGKGEDLGQAPRVEATVAGQVSVADDRLVAPRESLAHALLGLGKPLAVRAEASERIPQEER
eukprot:scaffold122_cov236-Pinguiococcus_pyrenoidosus.AAC.19